MKANEAPEKIYMTPSFGEPDNILLASFSKSHLDYHRDIEYTRTDTLKQEWKPSEKQLNALHDAAVYVDKSMFPYPKGILMKLYKQLKKLKEE